MSGVFKSIGKVFKKVVKVVKKIAVPALAIAAVVFTGGAALGLGLPTFAGAMSSVVGSLGLSGGLATALSTGLTGAGFGALVGGKKGAMMGFLGGAAIGGGLLGGAAGAAGGAGSSAVGVAGAGSAAAGGAGAVGNFANAALSGVGGAAGGAAGAASGVAAGVGGGAGGLLGGLGSNQFLVPSILQGVGGAMQAKSDRKAAEKLRDERSANLSLEGGILDPKTMGGIQGTGKEYSPYDVDSGWEYDPKTSSLVKKGG